jgi:branched-chain amino acid transport system substrate-binding protein
VFQKLTFLKPSLAVALAVLLSALGGNVSAEGPWKVGLVICLTGKCATYGTNTQNGVAMAAAALNAQGGVLGRKIELAVEDTDEASTASKAVSAYKKLRSEPGIRYFIGPSWTPAGLALAPIVAKDLEIIMTSPSLGAPGFHLAGDNIFNTNGINEAMTRADARYAFELGLRRAAVFSSQQPWDSDQARYFEDEFKKLGGTIVAKEEPLPEATNLSAETLRIVSAKPEVVFLATMLVQGLASRELSRLGYAGFRMASLIDAQRISDAAGTLEGTVSFAYNEADSKFSREYEARYGMAPEIEAAIAYDTLMAYAEAVRSLNTFDVTQVKKKLVQMELKGVSGPFKFDAQGCALRPAVAWVVKNGKLVHLNPQEGR